MQPAATFDYVILGGGSAGCVLAERLTADGKHNVVLIEAGGPNRNPLYDFPMLAGHFYRSATNNWGYRTTPQRHLDGRSIYMPRGRMLGGSFIFNGMVYIRGQAQDYDSWAQQGNRGWSFAEVLPYFKRSEAYEDGASRYHGASGRLPVRHGRSSNPLFSAFVAAGNQAGYPVNRDFNGGSQTGFGIFDYNIEHGRRRNTAKAFLAAARRRPNLTVITGATAERLIFDGRKATAVAICRGARREQIAVAGEVILAAGAINSPQLLLLSGVGPAHQLVRHDIDVVNDLPGVGQNLHDHLDVALTWQCLAPVSLVSTLRADRFAFEFLRSVLFRTGPLSASANGAGCFIALSDRESRPDAEGHFMAIAPSAARVRFPFSPLPRDPTLAHSFGVRIGPLRPRSRGALTLGSADPAASPLIDPNYLDHETDRAETRACVKAMRHVMQQPAMTAFRGVELTPGKDIQTDDEIDAWCRETASTVHHPVGTAMMGQGRMAVVDDELRVHGLSNVRVADASIMPTIVSGNTNAPTIMIAEKAADMILGRAPLPAEPLGAAHPTGRLVEAGAGY